MLNWLAKKFLNKEIVLYSKHRQTNPIVDNELNKSNFIFVSASRIWASIPIKSKFKLKFKIAFVLMKIINPKYVLNINWIGDLGAFYKLWSKKNKDKKVIVLQHGSYVGGEVTDIAHRYTNCDVFLVWGDYFKNLFEDYNPKKEVKIITFGNTIFNKYDRSKFSYANGLPQKILLAPSGIAGNELNQMYRLYEKLIELGFEVHLKEHNFQTKRFAKIDDRITRNSSSSESILSSKIYDVVISDHSSLMLDAIFFKNKIVYFSTKDIVYSKYLKTVYNCIDQLKSKDDFISFINIENQETLFNFMVYSGKNILNQDL